VSQVIALTDEMKQQKKVDQVLTRSAPAEYKIEFSRYSSRLRLSSIALKHSTRRAAANEVFSKDKLT